MPGFYGAVIVFSTGIMTMLAVLAAIPSIPIRSIEIVLLATTAGIFAVVLLFAPYIQGTGPLSTPAVAVYLWLPVFNLLIYLAFADRLAIRYAFGGLLLIGVLTLPSLISSLQPGEAGDVVFVLLQVYLANAVLIATMFFFATFLRRYRSLEETTDAMRKLANTDTLTGLGNRRHVERALDNELMRAERYDRPFSVIMTDINDFKRLNDRYGHPAGDEVLVELANRLSHSIRAADRIGRWGGEEFLILTPETQLEDAAQLAEVMRAYVAAHPLADRFAVTLSFGVASYRAGDKIDDLYSAFGCHPLRGQEEGQESGRDRPGSLAGRRLSGARHTG